MEEEKQYPPTLSKDDIIGIHESILEPKNLRGVHHDKLEGIICRVEKHIYYDGLVDPFEISSWYGFAIARGHGFVDGNKRTATICIASYLEISNIEANFEQEELADNIEKIAKNEMSQEELLSWLKDVASK